MRKLLTIIGCVLALCGCAQEKQTDKSMENKQKVLVAYFSATGTTERVAKAIAQATDATLYEIVAEPRFTSADLDWNNPRSRSSVEMKDEACRPALGGDAIDASEYDVIFLGYPIWWDLAPRQVNTWIESQRLEEKRVIPFATSGGSTVSGSVRDLRRLYPNVDWTDGLLMNCSPSAAADRALKAL